MGTENIYWEWILPIWVFWKNKISYFVFRNVNTLRKSIIKI